MGCGLHKTAVDRILYMRLKLNKDNYIVGYGAFGNPTYPEYEWEKTPELLTGKYNRPLYKWNGKEPVYLPKPYTPEQTEQLRKEWCKKEIKKLYSSDEEAQILRENMLQLSSQRVSTEAFIIYNENVQKILADSFNHNQ